MIRDPPAHLTVKPDQRAFRRPAATSGCAYYAWRIRMWVEGTFALSVMEPWEKYLVLSIFFLVTFLALTVVIRVLPFHLIHTLYQTVVSANVWKWQLMSHKPSSFSPIERQAPFTMVVGNYSARLPSPSNLISHFLQK
ncbi:hypothetical protein PM082_001579 [Marasmius tenuissimus]|nr:hypothetical protein PM082_001579 [Marasmius tenuissimus]